MKLILLGDVMLGRLVNAYLKRRPPEFPWGDTLPVLASGDVRICNLECAISDRGREWTRTPKIFHFRTDAKNVECLKRAGINAVSLANNHTLDYDYEALIDTVEILDGAGIDHAGAGLDLNEASRPCFFTAGGVRIGLIAFTDNEPEWEAAPGTPGIFYVPTDIDDERAQFLFSRVREMKELAEFVIVSAHWGPNWGYRPYHRHIPFAHMLVESGADLVFGHSCHVFQGIEVFKGKPIIYSAGDFVDDYAVDEDERNDESFIFTVDADKNRVDEMKLYPTIIDRFRSMMAGSERAKEIALKMQRLFAEFGTEAEWDEAERALKVRIS